MNIKRIIEISKPGAPITVCTIELTEEAKKSLVISGSAAKNFLNIGKEKPEPSWIIIPILMFAWITFIYVIYDGICAFRR